MGRIGVGGSLGLWGGGGDMREGEFDGLFGGGTGMEGREGEGRVVVWDLKILP